MSAASEIRDRLRGPAALVMTPFDEDLAVDPERLRSNIEAMVQKGFGLQSGFLIVPCGTGEYVSLTGDESALMVRTATEATKGEVPLVAGVAATDLRDAVDKIEKVREAGAHCVMLPPPFYYTLNDEATIDWYQLIADRTEFPIMAYDQDWRGGAVNSTLELRHIARLADVEPVISLKHGGTLDIFKQVEVLREYRERFACIDSSLGYTTVLAHMHGAQGYISGPATWWPEFEIRYWDLVEKRDYLEAEAHHYRLHPYMARFHAGTEFGQSHEYFDSAVIKAALEYVGLYGGPVRPPFKSLVPEQTEKLYAVLSAIGAGTTSWEEGQRPGDS